MTAKKIPDQAQRDLALDPAHSFIVQAPAGSGKTELLIQRFLCLLAYVQSPEEIIALTFTRKAAEEMRLRIIQALKKAKDKKPTTPHAAKTWELANDALKKDNRLNWQLLDNPNRLRIQTIDALCARLTHNMPTITENPERLYQKAVQNLFAQIDEASWSNALIHLLQHLDNRLAAVEALLISMLGKRDQWLPHIMAAHRTSELREILEVGLTGVTEDAVEALVSSQPTGLMPEIRALVKLANESRRSRIKSLQIPDKFSTQIFRDASRFSGMTGDGESNWHSIANLLLTSKNELRKTVTKREGFPAKNDGKTKEEKALFAKMKVRAKTLLTQLTDYPEFIDALATLRSAPPIQYNEPQWQTIESLVQLLPIVAAELTLVFQQVGEVDFIEISQAAIAALGDDESPTDLALTLDYQIKHLLIDEFQDTSNSQYRLLEKLTLGWEPNDGRTLFIVGDPMQSIYRFREAEVGLFLRTRQEGINNIQLTPITLQTNFRSTPEIISWVNESFIDIFPKKENVSEGAVIYSPAIAIHQNTSDTEIKLHPHIEEDDEFEAKRIVQIIHKQQKHAPNETIAILVKARSHLVGLLPILRANNLSYQAVEIDALGFRPIIQDLWSLTKALLYPADRTAWFSVLRAPWCGLTLTDLHKIASDETVTILDAIQDKTRFNALSNDGKERLKYIQTVLLNALSQQQTLSLRDWIYKTWIELSGAACCENHADLDDAETYFKLLDQYDSSFEEKLFQLFASTNHHANPNLQIMTVHKAKGLEFDTVILPQLHRKSPAQKTQLLLWMERPRLHFDADLLLAPIKPAHAKEDPIYSYLYQENAKKAAYENQRLFYVAVTRAKKQLHLLGKGYLTDEADAVKNPIHSSFLSLIWPYAKPDFFKAANQKYRVNISHVKTPTLPVLGIRRLPIAAFKHPITLIEKISAKKENLTLEDSTPSITGTLIHHILQQIATEGLDQWSTERIKQTQSQWKNLLLQMGLLQNKVDDALKNIAKAIHNCLTDKKARWILTPQLNAQSELPITINQNNQLKNIVIDRTFIDDNTRWIIDYKTTAADIQNETELLRLAENYRSQLETYASIFKSDDLPIKTALYFPLQKIWHEL